MPVNDENTSANAPVVTETRNNPAATEVGSKTYKLPRATCEHCHGSFAEKALERHKLVCEAAGERKVPLFPCTHARCGKTFTRADKLKAHVDEHHKYVCTREGCTFSSGDQVAFEGHRTDHQRAAAQEELLKAYEAYQGLEQAHERKRAECAALEVTVVELRAELAAARAMAVAATAEAARLRGELEKEHDVGTARKRERR